MPKSGIDLVLLFDLPDDIALKRAEGRTCKSRCKLKLLRRRKGYVYYKG